MNKNQSVRYYDKVALKCVDYSTNMSREVVKSILYPGRRGKVKIIRPTQSLDSFSSLAKPMPEDFLPEDTPLHSNHKMIRVNSVNTYKLASDSNAGLESSALTQTKDENEEE